VLLFVYFSSDVIIHPEYCWCRKPYAFPRPWYLSHQAEYFGNRESWRAHNAIHLHLKLVSG